jgi:hypothetical protein
VVWANAGDTARASTSARMIFPCFMEAPYSFFSNAAGSCRSALRCPWRVITERIIPIPNLSDYCRQTPTLFVGTPFA